MAKFLIALALMTVVALSWASPVPQLPGLAQTAPNQGCQAGNVGPANEFAANAGFGLQGHLGSNTGLGFQGQLGAGVGFNWSKLHTALAQANQLTAAAH